MKKNSYFSPLNYSEDVSPKSKKRKNGKKGRKKKEKYTGCHDIDNSGPALYERFEYGMSDW